jgi:hypothetical protein
MIRNLISKSPGAVVNLVGVDEYRDYMGLLTSPRNRKDIASAVAYGAPWAADNDAFGFWRRGELYDPAPMLRFLQRWRAYAGQCLFVNAVDVLLDARATLANFWYWREIIHAYGYPVAFTVQNGIGDYPPPWGYFDVLFIGATNDVKYSRLVADIVAEARRRGLPVHNGRVNTVQAVAYSRDIGCTSFDGTSYTHKLVEQVQRVIHHQKQVLQPRLLPLEAIE